MPFSVQILGCGSALPTLNSNQSAQVVEVDNEVYLLDCGEGTQIQIRKNKVKVQKIDHIFISHLHGDHFFGLVGLMSTMHLLGRKKDLHIHGPAELEEIISIQFRNAGSHLSFLVHFHVVDEGNVLIHEDKSCQIYSLPLKHRIPCFGFLIREKPKALRLNPSALAKYKVPVHARKSLTEGKDFKTAGGELIPNTEITLAPEPLKSYAYCSDTAYNEELVELIRGADLLYHESTFLETDRARAKKTFHSTAADAADIANKAGVKKLLLGHFSNRYKDRDAFLREAHPIFKETELAEEGKKYLL